MLIFCILAHTSNLCYDLVFWFKSSICSTTQKHESCFYLIQIFNLYSILNHRDLTLSFIMSFITNQTFVINLFQKKMPFTSEDIYNCKKIQSIEVKQRISNSFETMFVLYSKRLVTVKTY